MARTWLWLLFSGLATLGCGPDRANELDCTSSTPHPDFSVTLLLRNGRLLAPDTVVHVTYGGSGMEDYSPTEQGVTHEVVFCHAQSADGGVEQLDAAAAAGAAGTEAGIDALECDLWTGGFAKIEVHTDGLDPVTYDLTPRGNQCTVLHTFVLDSPDGG